MTNTPTLIKHCLMSTDSVVRAFGADAAALYADGYKASARAKALAALKGQQTAAAEVSSSPNKCECYCGGPWKGCLDHSKCLREMRADADL